MAEIRVADSELWAHSGDKNKPSNEKFAEGNLAGVGVAPPLNTDHNYLMNRAAVNEQALMRAGLLQYDATENYDINGLYLVGKVIRVSKGGVGVNSTATDLLDGLASIGDSYTKVESDGKYPLIGDSYTKDESNVRYPLKASVTLDMVVGNGDTTTKAMHIGDLYADSLGLANNKMLIAQSNVLFLGTPTLPKLALDGLIITARYGKITSDLITTPTDEKDYTQKKYVDGQDNKRVPNTGYKLDINSAEVGVAKISGTPVAGGIGYGYIYQPTGSGYPSNYGTNFDFNGSAGSTSPQYSFTLHHSIGGDNSLHYISYDKDFTVKNVRKILLEGDTLSIEAIDITGDLVLSSGVTLNTVSTKVTRVGKIVVLNMRTESHSAEEIATLPVGSRPTIIVDAIARTTSVNVVPIYISTDGVISISTNIQEVSFNVTFVVA